jgi:murein DD-endopeptidase MepM/ murein hydrolase activator NlpD
MKLFNPAPGRPVTSSYGPRRHPITGEIGKMHHGIDYGGTFPVLAAQDGIVVHIGWSPRGGGHVVIVRHASNLFTVYYHGKEKTKFKKNDRVMTGDVIYTSGSTGASTGPHLHFEVRSPTRLWGQTKDPKSYMTDKPISEKPNTGGDLSYNNIAVNGRLDRNTWKAWQEALKARHGYRGIIDGKPGTMTWSSIQQSAKKYYKGKIDGIPGPLTRRAVQEYLKDKKYYTGPIDGIWGKGTISALQRALNEGKY